MAIYQIVSMTSSLIMVLGVIGAAVVYLIRKNDKVKNMSDRIPEIEALSRKIEEHDRRFLRLEDKTGSNESEIHAVRDEMKDGFNGMKHANSLVLEGISAIIEAMPDAKDHEGLIKFKEKLSENTIIGVKKP